jgi:uncharacterized protein DUF4238
MRGVECNQLSRRTRQEHLDLVCTRTLSGRRAVLQFGAADLVIGAAAGRGDKHHYIPVFYSKEWAGPDGRLCEYSRPYDVVKPKLVHPKGTGYVRGLYTVPQNDPRVAEFIEREFFRITDNGAACALRMLKSGQEVAWTSDTRSAWSRFIISLMLRNPEYVARIGAEVVGFFDPNSGELNKKYQEIKRLDDPATYEEYIAKTGHPAGRASAIAMQTIIDSPRMGGHLNQMRWSVVTFKNPKHTLLTSDRPIIMTNGLAKPRDHLSLPIGPLSLFVATNNVESENIIKSMDPRDLMEQVNDRVASQARRFVYGTDDRQLRFVSKRLGQKKPSIPLEARYGK